MQVSSNRRTEESSRRIRLCKRIEEMECKQDEGTLKGHTFPQAAPAHQQHLSVWPGADFQHTAHSAAGLAQQINFIDKKSALHTDALLAFPTVRCMQKAFTLLCRRSRRSNVVGP